MPLDGILMSVSSIVDLKLAIQYLANEDDDWDEKALNIQEFKVAETLVKVLGCIKQASKLWEADITPTIHLVVRELFNIRGELENYEKSSDRYIANFAAELKKNIDNRFPDSGTGIDVNCIGHFLDPEYRGAILNEFPGSYANTREKIIEISSRREANIDAQPRKEVEQINNVRGDECNLTPAQKLLSRQRQRRQSSEAAASASDVQLHSSIEAELQLYENMDVGCKINDVLCWWYDNKDKFPGLFKVVREVFAIPASSASSERAFSSGTQVNF